MRFSREDWSSRQGDESLLADMARALRTEGYFICENVLAPDTLESLQTAFGKVLNDYIANHDSNRGDNRFNTHLYVEGPFATEEFVANPLIVPLIHKLLGIDAACTWASADTPLPGSDYQFAHADGRPLFRDQGLSLPMYAMAVNFPLVDFTRENGPLEIWPNGSHLVSDVAPEVGVKGRDPEQVLMSAGSMLVRDNRMWHRGSPNFSQMARPNLALVYNRSWYRFEGEAGHTPPAVSPETYAGWSVDVQRLFRFATTDLALTEKHRVDMVYHLETLEEAAGVANIQHVPMDKLVASF